ncbi:16S rRNA (guanine(527)-N(7))-methyltransferase RsmG [Thiomonas sp.]|jgi:16S rRNA (guanine527-N7)-methyltransferase|uniref:16S rRNA (guanine(527)-N(7))-methyltransferase RsmG n=1 Tax=Thiomonas sp. TaxID=2047785 RepID=UPI0026058279|nr:16S rRNA (guanine(527)-N(7))-methyltransferase RsmG [Thiomonas sp.]
MSPPAREQLAGILAALRLDADATQIDQLLRYLELLQRWNAVYNLTAVREPAHMLTLHLADSLSLIPALDRHHPRRVLDVGSGGGLPGLVLAIMRPQWQLVLVDAVQKKCAFVQQVAATLQLRNVEVAHGRIEQLNLPGFDCITSRAVGELAELVRISEHVLLAGGSWAAMKGGVPEAELQGLPPDIAHDIEILDVPGLQAQRCVVWMHRAQAPAAARPGDS